VPAVRPVAAWAATAIAAISAGVSGYLLALLAASARREAPRRLTPSPWRSLILVPAHDEESLLGDTLGALTGLGGGSVSRDVIVVADHCNDRTVAIARRIGVEVLDRREGERGKGRALAWAFDQLNDRLGAYDAVVVVDADTRPAPNLLTEIQRCMQAGARIVQVDNQVSNAQASASAGLRDAAFRLMNTIRPAGKSALGLSAGLRGTGMAFRPDVLRVHGWSTESFVEDFEHHLVLVAAGERVVFTRSTRVRSPMPTSLRVSRDQELRWESARFFLLRRYAAPLLRAAIRHRDIVRADAVADLLIPPQSLLLVVNVVIASASVAARARAGMVLSALATIGQLAFVLLGLRAAGAPATTYRALASTPRLMAQKLLVASTLMSGRGPRRFSRTPREPAPPA